MKPIFLFLTLLGPFSQAAIAPPATESIWDAPDPEAVLLGKAKEEEIPTAADRVYSALEIDPNEGVQLEIGEDKLIDPSYDAANDPDLLMEEPAETKSEFEKMEEQVLKMEKEQAEAMEQLRAAQRARDKGKKIKARQRLRRLKRLRNPGWEHQSTENIYSHQETEE